MAIDVTLTQTALVPDTATGDLVAGGTSVTAGQTFRVKLIPTTPMLPMHGGEDKISFILEEQNTGAATVQFGGIKSDGTVRTDNLAGDYPPSQLADEDVLSVSLAQADLKEIVLKAGKYLTNDGFICGLVSTNTVKITVLRRPAGY